MSDIMQREFQAISRLLAGLSEKLHATRGEPPQQAQQPAGPKELKAVLDDHHQWLRSLFDPAAKLAGRRARLSGANLQGASFEGLDLRGADFSGCNLEGANFAGADLSLADFRRANLFRARLSGATLRATKLGGADLRNADLSNVFDRETTA